jgi:hypothetical protein
MRNEFPDDKPASENTQFVMPMHMPSACQIFKLASWHSACHRRQTGTRCVLDFSEYAAVPISYARLLALCRRRVKRDCSGQKRKVQEDLWVEERLRWSPPSRHSGVSVVKPRRHPDQKRHAIDRSRPVSRPARHCGEARRQGSGGRGPGGGQGATGCIGRPVPVQEMAGQWRVLPGRSVQVHCRSLSNQIMSAKPKVTKTKTALRKLII